MEDCKLTDGNASEMKDSFKERKGFIPRYSWINTYFEIKEIDKNFSQKTTQTCIKYYHDLKKAPKNRYLSDEAIYSEVGEAILDVTRNLIPQITTEKEFCSLIKGVHLFNMMEAGDRIFHFESLDPAIKQLSFTKVQQEFKTIAHTILREGEKWFLAAAILTVDTAYHDLTSLTLPLPKWVTAYLKSSLKLQE